MKEAIYKILANLVVTGLVLKILFSNHKNLSVWEKENELYFLENEINPNGMNHSIKTIVNLNNKLVNNLDELRKTLFFKIFKVNLGGECNHFTQNMICNFPSCGVCQCEDSEIPLPWKQSTSKKEELLETKIEDQFYKWVDKYNISSNHWILDSETNCEDGTYVNLLQNPEAYTGYQGQHIWNAIFRENCFSDRLESICTEEKVFYKIFSGLLCNINIHISSNYYDNIKNHSYVNLTMFKERISSHKERIDNLFFLFSVLVKAFDKSEYILRNYEMFTGNHTEDNNTMRIIDNIYNSDEFKELSNFSQEYDEEINKFLNFNRLDQLMMRFRNISNIIECVSCQKCKLHGKLQIYGIATMLKILFDKNYSNRSDKNINLEINRNELIAFVNLFAKVSRSISYMNRINDNIRYAHFIHRFKYVFILFCYLMILVYINFYLFTTNKNKKCNDKKCDNKHSHAHKD